MNKARKKWKPWYYPRKIKATDLISVEQIFRESGLITEIKNALKNVVIKKHRHVIRYIMLDLCLKWRQPFPTVIEGTYKEYYYMLESIGSGLWKLRMRNIQENSVQICVLKSIHHAGTESGLRYYIAARTQCPKVDLYLPKFYGIMYEWQIAEMIDGLGDSHQSKKIFFSKLKTDEFFRSRYAKAIFDLFYFSANNNLVLGDLSAFIGDLTINNFFVHEDTAAITLIEYGSFITPSLLNEDFSAAENICGRIIAELSTLHTYQSKTQIEIEKIDIAFQLCKYILNAFSPSELRTKKKYLCPKFVEAIVYNDVETFLKKIIENNFLVLI